MTQKQDDTWPVEVVRSARRTKSVSAELRQGVLVVRAPAGMSDAEFLDEFSISIASLRSGDPDGAVELAGAFDQTKKYVVNASAKRGIKASWS